MGFNSGFKGLIAVDYATLQF